MNYSLQQVQPFHDQTFAYLLVEENSPMAMRKGLEAYATLRSTDPTEHQQYLQSMLFRSIQTPYAREGIAAFKEKRKPV